MTPVQQFVIQRFINLYGAPNATDLPKFFAEYAKALDKIDAKRLSKAIDQVVADNGFHIWPTVGACVAAVRTVSFEKERAREFANYKRAEDRREPSAAEKARVKQLAASGIAKLQALDAVENFRPPLPNTDRVSWEQRQRSLLRAGKWCLSAIGIAKAA